jgi:hypothetical protein
MRPAGLQKLFFDFEKKIGRTPGTDGAFKNQTKK